MQQLAGPTVNSQLQIIASFSQPLLEPLLPHILRTEQLGVWCKYAIDSWLQQQFFWADPPQEHLWWWLNLQDGAASSHWLQQGLHQHNLGWHLAVASANFSAAQAWFLSELDKLYVQHLPSYQQAICTAVDCGSSRGLALELSAAAEDDELDLNDLPAEAQIQFGQTISLADISAGIPQVLGSSPPGTWLPPVFNGESWILLYLNSIERPTLTELTPHLLRRAMQEWHNTMAQSLIGHWLSLASSSRYHA